MMNRRTDAGTHAILALLIMFFCGAAMHAIGMDGKEFWMGLAVCLAGYLAGAAAERMT